MPVWCDISLDPVCIAIARLSSAQARARAHASTDAIKENSPGGARVLISCLSRLFLLVSCR